MELRVYDEWFLLTSVILLGLIFGSFATAVAYRVPRGEGIVAGRSRCTSCGHKLGVLDLFPALSWLLQWGKCRYCKVEIGSSYILVELSLTLMFVLVYLQTGISLQSAVLMLLATCTIILIAIDFEHYIIPDGLNVAMFLLGIAYNLVLGVEWSHYFIGPVFGLALGMALRWMMWVWKKKEGLGMGDVKFLVVVGLFIPIEVFTTFLFVSGLLGIVTALVWSVLGRGKRFPFGPALSVSLLVCLVYPEIHNWWQMQVRMLVENWVS